MTLDVYRGRKTTIQQQIQLMSFWDIIYIVLCIPRKNTDQINIASETTSLIFSEI